MPRAGVCSEKTGEDPGLSPLAGLKSLLKQEVKSKAELLTFG